MQELYNMDVSGIRNYDVYLALFQKYAKPEFRHEAEGILRGKLEIRSARSELREDFTILVSLESEKTETGLNILFWFTVHYVEDGDIELIYTHFTRES